MTSQGNTATTGEASPRPRMDAGRSAATLLLPQVALGVFLAFVPDNALFVGTQIATLVHVLLGVLTLPLIVWLGIRHGRRLAPALQSMSSRVITGIFVAVIIAACASGVAVVFAYGRAPARLHAVFGLTLAVPMALHLFLARRRALGVVSALLFSASIAGVCLARARAPEEPPEPLSPEFAYQLRPANAYDDSEWCGECHRAEFESWARSTHARTLEVGDVFKNYVKDQGQRGHRLTEVRAILDGSLRLDGLPNNVRSLDACVSCHAPTAYYGDAPEPLEERARAGGVGCSFCHTIRGAKKGHRVSEAFEGLLRGKSDFDATGVFAARVDYVSAPETVRRYLFQANENPLVRKIGDSLIRWRPSMHSHDYDSPQLHDDGLCRSCHSFAWTTSSESLNVLAPDPRTPRTLGPRTNDRTCSACHMRDAKATVGVSHLFLGGNAKGAALLGDAALAIAEHDYGLEGPTLAVTRATLRSGAVDVSVDVRSQLPHAFPTTTGESRVGWIRVFVIGPDGTTIADTQGAGVVPEALVLPAYDRLEPYEARTISTTLPLPNSGPVKIVAELYHSFDKAPIAQATFGVN
jgi:hypothetical protein